MKIIIFFGMLFMYAVIALGVFLFSPKGYSAAYQLATWFIISFIATCMMGIIIGLSLLGGM